MDVDTAATMSMPRADAGTGGMQPIALGNLSLDMRSYRAVVDGRLISLTFHEFELLRVFCEHAGRIIAYHELALELWGVANRGAIRHLNVIVHRLRSKLVGFDGYVIETVRGRGYGLLSSRLSSRP